MFYTIYKVTNLINNKIYIGKHQTKNPHDSYYGSGYMIAAAIEKYGKENFRKEFLFIFDNEKEMNEKEKELITEEFVNREDTYNLGVGGQGGPHFKNKKHSEETKKLLGAKSTNYFSVEENRLIFGNKMKGKTHSEETKQKIGNKRRNTKQSEETKTKISNSLKGKKRSEEDKRKISIGMLRRKTSN